MPTQIVVAVSAGVLIAFLVAIAEFFHARRVRRVGRLAFGTELRPRAWTRVVPPLRSVCMGGFAWALTTLIVTTTGLFQQSPPPMGSGTRHLVFVVDLSPSMYLKDAGPKRDTTRRARMSEVVNGVLERVGGDVSFSVVGFYTDALPVALKSRDREVVRNALDGLPLHYAMGKGQTDLGLSISKAMAFVEGFPKGSVSMFICTDGDTVTLAAPLVAPKSVERTTIMGVGDTQRGTFIDGHQSRQDANVLRSIASSLSAEYVDVNDRHLPTSALTGLIPSPGMGGKWSLTEIAILVMGVTAAILALIPVAQQYAGTGWRVRSPAAARSMREAA